MVRVYEDYVDIMDGNGHCKGNLRVIIYLEDNGVSKGGPKAVQKQSAARPQTQQLADGGQVDYQAVWQLEMWKRAEEAKFKAYLKQKEIEKIEEITA